MQIMSNHIKMILNTKYGGAVKVLKMNKLDNQEFQ